MNIARSTTRMSLPLLAITIHIIPISAAHAGNPWSAAKLSTSSQNDRDAYVSGNRVVWIQGDGTNAEVMYYDGSTITPITTNALQDTGVRIDGNRIAWQQIDGDADIMLWDNGIITPLTTGSSFEDHLALSSQFIAWRRQGGDHEIVVSDGFTTGDITENACHDVEPVVSGHNIVYREYRGAGQPPPCTVPFGDSDLFHYDALTQTTTRITSDGHTEGDFQNSGINTVWVTSGEIYLWDGSTTTRLTFTPELDKDPQISGGNVVWHNNNVDIFFYDGITITNITDDAAEDRDPCIDGNDVVWRRVDPVAGPQIMHWNGGDIHQVSDHASAGVNPFEARISGDTIVWVATDPPGIDGEPDIFIATRPAPPCLGDLSGDHTVVDFSDLLALFSMWGPCPAPCPGDLAAPQDNTVDFQDLLALFALWGPCS